MDNYETELFAALLRAALREGNMSAAIASLERAHGAPLVLDPAFTRRAERTAARIRARLTAIDAADGGSALGAYRAPS